MGHTCVTLCLGVSEGRLALVHRPSLSASVDVSAEACLLFLSFSTRYFLSDRLSEAKVFLVQGWYLSSVSEQMLSTRSTPL